ncbi:beta-1,3-galactosyltransferase 1-like [Argopecten irradians]|uniref:beta-1,3-galactosyltransferase 1-like n=1 Tax=Argopecten irradians TaxID=31199 RepID=UPI00371040EC
MVMVSIVASSYILLSLVLKNVAYIKYECSPPPFAISKEQIAFRHSNAKSITDTQHSYVIQEDGTCRKGETETFLFIAVCVSASGFKQRTVIRNTWGSIVQKDNKVKLLFFLGNPNNTTIQKAILNESSYYHDIVQDNFVDSYANLTLKSIFMLKWSSTFCVNTSYVLKVDDDMFINVPNLINFLNSTRLKNSVIGQRIAKAKPIRRKDSKWYTSEHLYNETYYPYYTSGTNYVISGDIVPKLYQSTFHEPFLWLEDVYITGLCRERIKANIIDNWNFSSLHPPAQGCSYKDVISGHKNTPTQISKIWRELNDPNLNCSRS